MVQRIEERLLWREKKICVLDFARLIGDFTLNANNAQGRVVNRKNMTIDDSIICPIIYFLINRDNL